MLKRVKFLLASWGLIVATTRIAVISRSLWPYVRGGAEKFIARLSEELRKLGFEVTIITRQAQRGDEEQLSEILSVGPSFSLPLISSYMFSRRAAATVNRLNVDAVIVNTYWGEAAPLYISRKKGRPVIISIIHDVGLLHSSIAKRNIVKHVLRLRVLRGVVERSDLIVVPTDRVKFDLVNFFGASPEKVYVLGVEGVDAPFTRIHRDNEYFDVLQVARFAPNKGQEIVLKAVELVAEKIPNLRVWLVGGLGPGSSKKYFEKVKRKAAEINRRLGREVVTIRVNVDDVSKYYELADICVAASVAEEGYGLIIPECLGYGKPVIASDLFAELGTARPEYAYIYPRYDVEALAQQLLHVYNHMDEALRKAETGMKVFSRAKWGNVARMVADRLLELLGSSGKST